MSSTTAITAVPPRPAPTPFTPRLACGLIGVLAAVLVSSFNEHVTDIDLADLRGALGIGYDDGTWLTAWYEAFQISAMAFAPWCAGTFSLRRFTTAMALCLAALCAIAPLMPDLTSLYVLRAVQGFAGGALPPMLMTVALRFLPPKLKVYGLGAYALTATCGPNLGTPIAAFVFEQFGWQGVLLQPIPLCLVSAALVFWGIPQDSLRLERFRQFDWRGLILGFPAISMLVIGLMQGDRLDWFNSSLICHLLVGGLFLFAMFLLNEWHHPLPFFRIQLLKSRDLSFGLIALMFVLTLAVANLELPSSYLAEVQGYRPSQIAPLALGLAIGQLLTLPLVAAVCNIRSVDCRWVLCGGILLAAIASYGTTFITSDWIRDNFYAWQALEVLAQPMIVIPILLISTMKLAPMDGPFVSGMFNMVKGFSSAIAAGMLGFLETWREHTHSNILIDRYGAVRHLVTGFDPRIEDLETFSTSVSRQALVLTVADLNLIMIGVAGLLFVFTLTLPTRVYPPVPAPVR